MSIRKVLLGSIFRQISVRKKPFIVSSKTWEQWNENSKLSDWSLWNNVSCFVLLEDLWHTQKNCYFYSFVALALLNIICLDTCLSWFWAIQCQLLVNGGNKLHSSLFCARSKSKLRYLSACSLLNIIFFIIYLCGVFCAKKKIRKLWYTFSKFWKTVWIFSSDFPYKDWQCMSLSVPNFNGLLAGVVIYQLLFSFVLLWPIQLVLHDFGQISLYCMYYVLWMLNSCIYWQMGRLNLKTRSEIYFSRIEGSWNFQMHSEFFMTLCLFS